MLYANGERSVASEPFAYNGATLWNHISYPITCYMQMETTKNFLIYIPGNGKNFSAPCASVVMLTAKRKA